MDYLSFSLEPENPYDLQYFVVHTGNAEAYNLLSLAVNDLLAQEDIIKRFFSCFFICGGKGSGKTHLCHGFIDRLIKSGFDKKRAVVFKLTPAALAKAGCQSSKQEEEIPLLVAEYERLKRSGGLLIVHTESDLEQVTSNPHLKSRLLAGHVCVLNYPKTEELEPVIKSLAAKKNLALSDKSVKLIVENLPLDTASFGEILDNLNSVALAKGKKVSGKLLRKIIKT